MKLPSWELAKEVADKLPGSKRFDNDKEDAKCETCGTPLDKDKKERR